MRESLIYNRSPKTHGPTVTRFVINRTDLGGAKGAALDDAQQRGPWGVLARNCFCPYFHISLAVDILWNGVIEGVSVRVNRFGLQFMDAPGCMVPRSGFKLNPGVGGIPLTG